MKKLLLFFTLFLLIPLFSTYSQTFWPPGGYDMRGDTIVIWTQYDLAGEPNGLYNVLHGDSINVPVGRVYMLKAGGVYPLKNNPTTWNRPTVIIGSDPTTVVTNQNANNAPPLICGYVGATSSNAGSINAGGDLTIKNCALVPAADDSTLGWAFTGTTSSNLDLVFDNCIMERTRWIFVGISNKNCNVTFRNCYFVNMNGQPCWRNGGVFDCFSDQDTLLVENCTFINAQSDLFNFRNYSFKRIIFNHNTFINCAGPIISNYGNQTNVSITNNLFINCNVQPFSAKNMLTCDCGTPDPDNIPMGLVNVNPYPIDSTNNPLRRYYVDKNLVHWDPLLSNVVDTVNQLSVNGHTDWQSQMITMNSRTQSMFDNNTTYPYLTEGVWLTEKPSFTDPKDLFSTQLINLKTFAVTTVDTGGINRSVVLPTWRVVNTGADKYVNPDWPIPVDLSYNNAELLTSGLGGFPIGDLNWFPTQKTSWQAQRTSEYATIQKILDGTLGVSKEEGLPVEFRLQQNYPNPFNPSTTISFSIPKTGHATLKVYNILGEDIATLLNGYTSSGRHEVQFNAANFASGVYFYKLTSGNYTEVKKMMMMK